MNEFQEIARDIHVRPKQRSHERESPMSKKAVDGSGADASSQQVRVSQKWGFGMAPPKPQLQQRRLGWVSHVLGLLKHESPHEKSPDAVSEVKGLFNRVVRQDQWDWFVVFQQLGCPARVKSRKVASTLAELRKTISTEKGTPPDLLDTLRDLGVIRYLTSFLSGEKSDQYSEQIYILSTREQPCILKIGFTTRSVLDRVNEINSATGVVIPYGVRAVWSVRDARDIEAKIHRSLADYRVRSDREFFCIDYKTAFKRINNLLKRERIGQR